MLGTERIKRAIQLCYQADVPCFLWGMQGIGKSQIVHQMAKESNAKFICKHFAQLELGDLVGMSQAVDRDGELVTDWARPKFFPTEDGPGIFFCDEFNRTNEVEMRALFEFILGKKINEYKLPKNWYVMAAGNPNSEEFYTRTMDLAMLSRFVHLKFEPDLDSFLLWAEDNGVHTIVTEFLKKNNEHFAPGSSMKDNFLNDIKLKPCPRTWSDMIGRILSVPSLTKNDLGDNGPFEAILEGSIGLEVMPLFLKHVKNKIEVPPLQGDDIIYNWDDIKGKVDTLLDPNNTRTDIIGASLTNLKLFILKKKIKAEKCSSVIDFFSKLPEDMLFGVMREWTNESALHSILVHWGNDERISSMWTKLKAET